MKPEVGYKRALELLKFRFGNNHIIAQAIIAWILRKQKVMNGPPFSAGNAVALKSCGERVNTHCSPALSSRAKERLHLL